MCVPLAAAAEATLTGPGGLSVALTPEGLAALPQQEVDTVHGGSHGESRGRYTGALLWDLIAAETDVDDDVKAALRRVVLVTASDGHQVAFSVGEIAPDFGNYPIMVGYELDGAPIPDGLRMVAPGDTRGARYVKDVVSIENPLERCPAGRNRPAVKTSRQIKPLWRTARLCRDGLRSRLRPGATPRPRRGRPIHRIPPWASRHRGMIRSAPPNSPSWIANGTR